jgi:tRNA-specific 2-thiouridylase
MFVAYKNYERNEVVIVDDPSHPSLMISEIKVKDFRWIWETHPPSQTFEDSGLKVGVRFRSTMQPVQAVLKMRLVFTTISIRYILDLCPRRKARETDTCLYSDSGRGYGTITFQEPQQAVAPGQVAAVYLDSWCLGCGTIDDFNSMPSSNSL